VSDFVRGSLVSVSCYLIRIGIQTDIVLWYCFTLGGSIGVFRGSIRDITDPTNEATAYAILGFAWGMGGGRLARSVTRETLSYIIVSYCNIQSSAQ
jgi:hypothetical protein